MEATERQKAFLKHLERQYPYTFAKALRSLKLQSAEGLSKAKASVLIGTILAGAQVRSLPPGIPRGAEPRPRWSHKALPLFSDVSWRTGDDRPVHKGRTPAPVRHSGWKKSSERKS